MEQTSRKKIWTDGLRPINQPVPIRIKTSKPNIPSLPAQVFVKNRYLAVVHISEIWHVMDEWWKPEPIDRVYFHLVLERDLSISIFFERNTGQWKIQQR